MNRYPIMTVGFRSIFPDHVPFTLLSTKLWPCFFYL